MRFLLLLILAGSLHAEQPKKEPPPKDINVILAEKADQAERTGWRLISTDATAGKSHLERASELRKLNGTKR